VTGDRDAVLATEIRAQPEALARFRTREGARVRALGRTLFGNVPRGVLIAARGSSDHAAVYAKYLFGERLRLPVALAAPSLVTRYGALPRLDGWLVPGISQSGSSPDIVAVLGEARESGCTTVAITDHPDSALAGAADELIDLCVGGERSVAATGTFTATLYALAQLACGGAGAGEDDLDAVPSRVHETLAAEPRVDEVARSLAACEQGVVLGRGYSFAVALEWGLKLKEVAGLWAEPFSAADYRHGPIALASSGVVALLVDPEGPGRADLRALAEALEARGVRTIRAADHPGAALPFAHGPEWLSPIPGTVPGQLLALHLARARGVDPDRPSGLTKVTRTL
jgi:glucosamine--fructose-6-phosphate aminotransferase (isomerizing)